MENEKLIKLENYIAGELFKGGIDLLLDNGIGSNPDGTEEGTFVILFESGSGKIISSTRKLICDGINSELKFIINDNNNGGVIELSTIPHYYTKNLLESGESVKADGFAIIRGECSVAEEITKPDGTIESVKFPNFQKKYEIAIKGILSNKPLFSNDTLFQFNSSSIAIGVTDTDERS